MSQLANENLATLAVYAGIISRLNALKLISFLRQTTDEAGRSRQSTGDFRIHNIGSSRGL